MIAAMGVELGIWQGLYQNVNLPWLRWWDSTGNLLLTGSERASVERSLVAIERQRAETERNKREILVDKLRELSTEQLNALGINPEMLE
jgi:hypothetical protein